MNKQGIDFSDEIRILADIKATLTILSKAGEQACSETELYSYWMLTNDAFSRHITG